MKKSKLVATLLAFLFTSLCCSSSNMQNNKAEAEYRITAPPTKEERIEILKKYPDECFDQAKAVVEK